jgi:hypothetical protein
MSINTNFSESEEYIEYWKNNIFQKHSENHNNNDNMQITVVTSIDEFLPPHPVVVGNAQLRDHLILNHIG